MEALGPRDLHEGRELLGDLLCALARVGRLRLNPDRLDQTFFCPAFLVGPEGTD
jgi:hypothetical protein